MNKCQNCNACSGHSSTHNGIENRHGYVKFNGDRDDEMWFHGLVYQRALELQKYAREEALPIIRKEFGISP